MADNQIDVSSVSDSRISKYSSVNINKSLSLARKISNSSAKEDVEPINDLPGKSTGDKFDINESAMLTERIMDGNFNFNDIIKYMELLDESTLLSDLIGTDPEIYSMFKIIISSMTLEERANPDLLISIPVRQRRLANKCGFSYVDINQFVTGFIEMRTMMQHNCGEFS